MGCGNSRIAKQGPARPESATSQTPLLTASTLAAHTQQDMHPISHHDMVFSCCVCHKTLSEIYDDGDHQSGLHHEPNQPTGRIVKLYLTECAHVVCAKHLEGGG